MRRHQLVFAHRAAWDSLVQSRDDLAGESLVRDWVRNGWPLIMRRRLPSEIDGLSLGLPLPPSAGKRRIAVRLHYEDIASTRPLPELTEVLGSAPVQWRPFLGELADIARTYGVRAGVFGSLGWQWLTGLNYLGPCSDVDIAWALPPRDRIDQLLEDLAELDSRSPVRLDGEFVREDGAGVNWRELRAGGAELALKTASDVILYPRAAFLGAAA